MSPVTTAGAAPAARGPAPGTLSMTQARLITGFTVYELMRRVIVGDLRAVAEPGRPIRYDAAGVRQLAAERGRGPTPGPAA